MVFFADMVEVKLSDCLTWTLCFPFLSLCVYRCYCLSAMSIGSTRGGVKHI